MMWRFSVVTGLLLASPGALVLPAPALAQSAQPTQQCAQDTPAKTKRSLFGSMLGNLADSALGRFGGTAGSIASSFSVGSMLSDAIVKLLDCKEQQQAAQATDRAIRGGVGTEVAWTSESRPNVSGKSKVTGAEKLADGGQCLTVTDVVIVDGEETSVPKRMCKAKGAKGFAKV